MPFSNHFSFSDGEGVAILYPEATLKMGTHVAEDRQKIEEPGSLTPCNVIEPRTAYLDIYMEVKFPTHLIHYCLDLEPLTATTNSSVQ